MKVKNLKLIARTEDDLRVVSAHLQDAIVNVADMPPDLLPSPPISTPTSTFPSILYITSAVNVKSDVIGPVIAHTVLPATGEPLEIKSESGHVPFLTLLPTPPVPPPPVGSDKDPNSPGEAMLVSPPPPQATSKKVDKIKKDFFVY